MAFTEPQAYELIKTAYEKKRLPHALLITGNEEDGTHTLALRLVETTNGEARQESLDSLLNEYCRIVRPRSKSRKILIDDIRAIEPFLQQRAPSDKLKIVIIIDAERMNDEASNAFLKTLEEPPPQSFIILITAKQEQLLETIISRCVAIPLYSATDKIHLTPIQQTLLPYWAEACSHLGNDLSALSFRSQLLNALAHRKNEITKSITQALKEENKTISQGTDESAWETQNKDLLTAAIETEYLNERDQSIELLITWFGQAILLASGARLSNALHAGVIQMAKATPVKELLFRMQAIESLRDNLKFNIHEGLAMDVHLLEALGEQYC